MAEELLGGGGDGCCRLACSVNARCRPGWCRPMTEAKGAATPSPGGAEQVSCAASGGGADLGGAGAVFENSGYCPCCRSETRFVAEREWLRDHYICTRCGSIPRQRHLQAVLDTRFPGWEALRIHESSPSSDFIRRHADNYTDSQYFPDVPRGEVREGVRCEDVEQLSFPDDSIDLFITQDVLEHVFDPRRAIKEIPSHPAARRNPHLHHAQAPWTHSNASACEA